MKQIDGNRDKPIIGIAARHLLSCLCLSLLTVPLLTFAQVQLPTVNLGDTNFEDAFGGPGWLLQVFPDAYVASELKDSEGKTIPGSNRLTAYSTTTYLAYISKERILGDGWQERSCSPSWISMSS